jgi:hypothetical protein
MNKLLHLAILLAPSIAQAVILTQMDVYEAEPPTAPEWQIEKELTLGNGNTFKAIFRFTKKGNGGLHLGNNLWVGVCDSHRDTEGFSDGILEMTLKDLNQDGVLDLRSKVTAEVLWFEKKDDLLKFQETATKGSDCKLEEINGARIWKMGADRYSWTDGEHFLVSVVGPPCPPEEMIKDLLAMIGSKVTETEKQLENEKKPGKR